ncbi:MAG: glycosyl hydrolase [Bacillota bacterium]
MKSSPPKNCLVRRALFGIATVLLFAGIARANAMQEGWDNPPTNARLRAYWWWLNGYVTPASITRDLEEMKAKGFGGALICDAGGAEQDGNDRVPHGPTFMTPEWRALYKHTLREAARLGLEMSLNIQSGWNLGGPMVKAEDSAKKLVWSEARASGPLWFDAVLAEPKHRDPYYRDLFVVAYPLKGAKKSEPKGQRRPIQRWEEKAMHKALSFSAPDTTPLLNDVPARAGEEDTRGADVVDLTARLATGGRLRWDMPAGDWEILRIGCTVGDHSMVSTSSDGWKGYAVDVLDEQALRRYWDAVVEPLIADAGALAGSTLKYLHTDSWEVEAINWTPALREEFRSRRGYDLFPFLPVIAGRIVDSRDVSNRFLHDFRRTLGDLAVDRHFKPFKAWAAGHGLQIHPESGGPHAVPIDAQQCLGHNDVPMSEFWAESWRHRVGDPNRFFVKQPASAAHTYAHRLVAAEGFTTIGPHWQETIWDNLKPSFDKACTEGMNLLVWHAFVCSPDEAGLPGVQYFAGTHFNPGTTWWSKSGPFLAYINRCQWMLQQGLFVADACYFYGDHVPNFAQLRSSDPARLGEGYDYDVITQEAILDRLDVRDGRLVLPDGMSYRLLVLPERPAISLPVLRKVKALVEAGATVVGPRPVAATGLVGFPASDEEVKQLAAELWGPAGSNVVERSVGRGRIIAGRTAREALLGSGVKPDFEMAGGNEKTSVGYLHRVDGGTDIYFVASRGKRPESLQCTFRVSGKAPELWNPVSGERRFAIAYREADGRTTVPLDFAPCGSWFVVFREPSAGHPATAERNGTTYAARHEIAGPWQVQFDPKWGGPASVQFEQLVSWPTRPEPGIRYYSGTATYRKTFDLPAELRGTGHNVWLDLGNIREVAEVRLNGRSLGILWCPPFRVDITRAARPTENQLEVEVVNFWPNRIIGDQLLPAGQRLTRTNVRKLTKETALMESGLLGPVRLMEATGR